MYKVIFFSLFISCASAIPSMAIPDLVYPSSVSVTPIGSNNLDGSVHQPNVDPTAITKQVRQQLPGFNADVRGAIISSGKFKVVALPKKSLDNKQLMALTQASQPVVSSINNKTKQTMPDYILIGKVVSITQNENFTPVKYTDKNSSQYNVDIAVDYKLVKTTDKSVMTSFTAYGHASDVKMLTAGNTAQIQNHNIPLLVKTASKNLGEDVLNQLNSQFNTSSENYDNGSRVITDVKVYSD